jgi:hypothetical protein
MTWMPIETAPKYCRILGYGLVGFDSDPGAATVRWNAFRKEWNCDPNEATEYDYEICKLTHWMPLPDPPKELA